jgi:hypothetical protein
MSQFKKIFSIQLKHLYYGTDQTKFINDFDIVPTPDTEILLKNHGMIWKQREDRIVILGQSVNMGDVIGDTEDDFKLLRPVGAKTKFRFLLKLKNNTFHNFTNIPLTGNEGKIYYFHNRQEIIPSSGHLDGDLLLLEAGHSTNYVNGTERLEVLSEVFTKTLPGSDNNVKIEDVYDSSNVVFNSGSEILSGSIQFDLRGKVKPGRYKLTQDGTPVGGEFYIDPELGKIVAFGVVEIFEVSTANPDCMYVDTDGFILNPVYVIAFENRSTYWKYFVHVNNSTIDPSELRIDVVDGASPIVFTGAPTVSGADAVFTSDSEIPLLYDTYKNIILYKMVSDNDAYNSGTDIAVLLNMPNPSVAMVKPGAPPDVFSEIFVYV